MKAFTVCLGIFVISFAVITIVFLSYETHRAYIKNLAYNINGKVLNVTYDDKREATVFINDTDYYLSDPNWDFYHNKIIVGDSITKKKNSMIIKLIKQNGKVIIEGKNK